MEGNGIDLILKENGSRFLGEKGYSWKNKLGCKNKGNQSNQDLTLPAID